MEISKELLGEVLEEEVLSVRPYIANDPFYKNIFIYECRKDTYDTINIYELAHKCKVWAFNNGYNIISDYMGLVSIEEIKTNNIIYSRRLEVREYKSIFISCEWIRKEIQQ